MMNINNLLPSWMSSDTSATDVETGSDNFSAVFDDLMSTEGNAATTEVAKNVVTTISDATEDGSSSAAADIMLTMLTTNIVGAIVETALTPDEAVAEESVNMSHQSIFENGDAMALADVIDVINPLQHVPIVSQYYREWTGDTIGATPQIAGGALYGGTIGVAMSFINIGLTHALGEAPLSYVKDGIKNYWSADSGQLASSSQNDAVEPISIREKV